nr:energy transducer TonB [uncultured Kingella sp.]
MRNPLLALITSLALIAPTAHAKTQAVKNTKGRAIKTVTPIYPVKAMENGIEGRVKLRVQVAPNNRIRSVEVVESSGSTLLDEAAVAAARQYRFQAATRGGKRVTTVFSPSFNFSLDD